MNQEVGNKHNLAFTAAISALSNGAFIASMSRTSIGQRPDLIAAEGYRLLDIDGVRGEVVEGDELER